MTKHSHLHPLTHDRIRAGGYTEKREKKRKEKRITNSKKDNPLLRLQKQHPSIIQHQHQSSAEEPSDSDDKYQLSL